MARTRRHFTAEQKATVVRRHVAGKEAVSDLADELDVQPSQIHLWIRQVLDQAEKAFERPQAKRAREERTERKIKMLEEKLAIKNEVISELMEENVKSKKANGEL